MPKSVLPDILINLMFPVPDSASACSWLGSPVMYFMLLKRSELALCHRILPLPWEFTLKLHANFFVDQYHVDSLRLISLSSPI